MAMAQQRNDRNLPREMDLFKRSGECWNRYLTAPKNADLGGSMGLTIQIVEAF
jgi:hypothetical protein